jgi:glycosyltransferase involved in cell wall biosynthesis
MLVENNPYPQDARVRQEATSLCNAGYEVTVIAPSSGEQPWQDIVDGVRAYRYPPPPEGDGLLGYLAEYGYSMVASLVLALYVFIRRGFDVIHVHNPPDTYFVIGGLFRLLGRTFVFDHHDLSPDMYLARFGDDANRAVFHVLRWMQRLVLRTANHVIATNDSYARVSTDEAGVPAHSVTVVRNGPDLRRVRRVPADESLRSDAAILIGYVGLMNDQDGLDYLLRALCHLRAARSDFMCVLVGRGDSLKKLRREADRLGLADHVRFTGRVPDHELMTILSTVDICVDPDPSNTFNDRSTMIKMTEYMALGKPIVAFDLPEHRVTAGDAALYAKPNDEADFARCIAALMDDPALRGRMGTVGRHRIVSDFSWHQQEQRLLDLYSRLAAAASPNGPT